MPTVANRTVSAVENDRRVKAFAKWYGTAGVQECRQAFIDESTLCVRHLVQLSGPRG